MSYKIAVASSDGEHVDTHFGHADRFLIFRVYEEGDQGYDPDTLEALEVREVCPACGAGAVCGNHSGAASDTDPMEAAAERLSDVSYVLVAMAGPHAVRTLGRYGVTTFAAVLPINEAVRKINQYRKQAAAEKHGVEENVEEGGRI